MAEPRADQDDDRQSPKDWRSAAGRKGGQTTRDRYGTELYRRAGRIGGAKGGAATLARYGREYFQELARKSAVARAARRAGDNDHQEER
jgi:hypothetical protein